MTGNKQCKIGQGFAIFGNMYLFIENSGDYITAIFYGILQIWRNVD